MTYILQKKNIQKFLFKIFYAYSLPIYICLTMFKDKFGKFIKSYLRSNITLSLSKYISVTKRLNNNIQ